ncbi:hypothetical protein CSUI_004039 [Cystoisospora suis]|uniref:Uncharacterized protein n=1 Tax=Cystoisospora suis TaxID=483139 RepID=A0A2C6KNQ5_9APIC|nr:hypothetical protein CSUI_004039 [Cystoisospora suis]
MASTDTSQDTIGNLKGLGFANLSGLKPETDETVMRACNALSREFEVLKLRVAQLRGSPEISPLQEQKLKEVVWAVLEGRPVPVALNALQDSEKPPEETERASEEKNRQSFSFLEKRKSLLEGDGDKLKRQERWQKTEPASEAGEKSSGSRQSTSPLAKLGAVLMSAAFGTTPEEVREKTGLQRTTPVSVGEEKTIDVSGTTLRSRPPDNQTQTDPLRATLALALEEGTLERHRQRGNLRLRQTVPLLEGRVNKLESEFGERLSQVEERLKKHQKVPSLSAGSQPLDGLVSMAHFKVIIGSLQHQIDSLSRNQVGLRSDVDQLSEVCAALQNPSAPASTELLSQYASTLNSPVAFPEQSTAALSNLDTELNTNSREEGDKQAEDERGSMHSGDGSSQSPQGIMNSKISPLTARTLAAKEGDQGVFEEGNDVNLASSSKTAKVQGIGHQTEKGKAYLQGEDGTRVQTRPEPYAIIPKADVKTASYAGSWEKTANNSEANARTNPGAPVESMRRSHYYNEENGGGTLLAQRLRSVSGCFPEAKAGPTSGRYADQVSSPGTNTGTARAQAEAPFEREQGALGRNQEQISGPADGQQRKESRTAAVKDYRQEDLEVEGSFFSRGREKKSSTGGIILIGQVENSVLDETDSLGLTKANAVDEKMPAEKQKVELQRSEKLPGEGTTDDLVYRASREARRDREERIYSVRPFDIFRAFLNCTAR